MPDGAERDYAAVILRAVKTWEQAEQRRGATHRKPPAAGSRWAEDLALADHGAWVRVYAGHSLSSAIDHLRAWAVLSERGQSVYAPWSLGRGVIEGAIRVRWHLEPDLASERVARGFAARRYDQVERRNVERLVNPGGEMPRKGKSAAERIAEVDALRESEGIARVDYRATTRLAADYGVEEFYRLASGYVHGLEWALASSTLTPAEPTDPRQRMGEGWLSPKDDALAGLAAASALALRAAIEALEAYVAPPRRGSR